MDDPLIKKIPNKYNFLLLLSIIIIYIIYSLLYPHMHWEKWS